MLSEVQLDYPVLTQEEGEGSDGKGQKTSGEVIVGAAIEV